MEHLFTYLPHIDAWAWAITSDWLPAGGVPVRHIAPVYDGEVRWCFNFAHRKWVDAQIMGVGWQGNLEFTITTEWPAITPAQRTFAKAHGFEFPND